MKAYSIKNYGEPAKVLSLTELEVPEPKGTEVQKTFTKVPFVISALSGNIA